MNHDLLDTDTMSTVLLLTRQDSSMRQWLSRPTMSPRHPRSHASDRKDCVNKAARRLFDVIASAVIGIITAPIVIPFAVAILLEDRGPLFYRQTRVGFNGRPFQLWKLRSMRVDAEVDGVAKWAETNDPRVTRVGRVMRKTRIDELPQLFNVVRGEMSIIGPRPERPCFVEAIRKELPLFNHRHVVKPGITGWAQVRSGYAASLTDAARKLEHDLYYVENRSLALDLRIVLETLRVVLLAQGAR